MCAVSLVHTLSHVHTLCLLDPLPRRNLTSAAPWKWPLWWGSESARICNQRGFGNWISTSKQVFIDNSNNSYSIASERWYRSTHLSIFPVCSKATLVVIEFLISSTTMGVMWVKISFKRSGVWTLGPHLVTLFGKVTEPLESVALLVEAHHYE